MLTPLWSQGIHRRDKSTAKQENKTAMSNRAVTILAIAAIISSLWIYATSAQVLERPRNASEGAIVVEQPPLRLAQELPGRYQVTPLSESVVVVIDTHMGQCWSKISAQSWRDWGTPVKPE